MLVNRMRPMLDKLISPNQGAFVPNRQMSENMKMANELLASFKIKKGLDEHQT